MTALQVVTYLLDNAVLFWLVLSFVMAFYVTLNVPEEFQFLGRITTYTLITFALAGIVQNMYPDSDALLLGILVFCLLAVAGLTCAILVYSTMRHSFSDVTDIVFKARESRPLDVS